MSIRVDLDNYNYAADELSKTSRRFSNSVSNIQSVISGLDHRVLAYVKEDLMDIRSSLNIMSKSAIKTEEDLLATRHKYEVAEEKAKKLEIKAVSIGASVAAGASVASTSAATVSSTKAVSSAKVEESTGGFLSKAFKSVSNFVTGTASSVGNVFKKAGKALKDTGAKVVNSTKTAASSVVSWFKKAGKALKDTGAKVVNTTKKAASSVANWFKKAGKAIKDTGAKVAKATKSIASKVAGFFCDVGDFLWTGIKKVGASVANFVIGLVQGLAGFVEAIVDTCAIIGTAVASIFTGLYDLGQWINGKITGNENWNSATKAMWGGVMDFVATTHVKDAFRGFYENTAVGKWLDANAFGWFKSTGAAYQVADGIGYAFGVFILTVVTFGAGGAAVGASSAATGAATTAVTAGQSALIAGAAGFGRGAETAWSQGADLGEGLAYAGLNAGWEGLQFYVGSKIGAPGGYGDQIAGKLLSQGASAGTRALVTSGTRITLDAVDGGVEGFVQPLLQSVYADGYYDDAGNFVEFTDQDGVFTRASALFDDMGGWKNVAIQTAVGAGGSAIGEIGDLRKFLKETPASGAESATATTAAIGTTTLIGMTGDPDVDVDLSPTPGTMTPAGTLTDAVDAPVLAPTGTGLSLAEDLDATAPIPTVGDGPTTLSAGEITDGVDTSGFKPAEDLDATAPIPIVGDGPTTLSAGEITDGVDTSGFKPAGDLDATAPIPIVGDGNTPGSGWIYHNADANTGKIDSDVTSPKSAIDPDTATPKPEAPSSATTASTLALQDQAAKMANMDFSDIPSGKTVTDVAGDYATEHSAKLFETYDAYAAATAVDEVAWRDAISQRTFTDPITGKQFTYLEVVEGYIGESDTAPGGYGLLNTVNRALDGDPATFLERLLKKDSAGNIVLNTDGTNTIEIRHCFGWVEEYRYDPITGKIWSAGNPHSGLNLDGSVGTLTDLVDRVQRETSILDEALSMSPQKGNIIVGRGAQWNALERFGISPTDSAEEIYRKLTANGSTYRDAGFMSSTPEMGGGFMNGSPVKFIMEVNDGSSTGNFSYLNAGEKEILINHGTEFDITSVRKDADGNVYIFLAEKVTPAFDGADLIDVKAFTDIEVAKKAGQEALDLRTEIEVEKAAVDLTDPNYAKKLAAIESKAKLETELLASIHSKGMTLEEYLAKCSEIPKFDPATTAIIQQQAKAIADKAASIEPGITSLMESLQDGNAHLVGLDYRFKSQSSIESKIARVMSNYGYSADIAGSQINDSLRYTLICDAATYSETVIAKLAKLKSEGYQIKYMNNAWGNSTYKGLNLTLTGPDGVDIELQFHTQASFDVKQTQNHLWYEISRSPNVDADVKELANQVQAMNQSIYNGENVSFKYGSYDIDVLNQDLDAYIAKNIAPQIMQVHKFDKYYDFVNSPEAGVNRQQWQSVVTDTGGKAADLLYAYKLEDMMLPGNYKGVNAALRGCLVDLKAKTVLIAGTGGSYKVSFDQFKNMYGIDAVDYYKMQLQAAKELSDAVSRCTLGQDMQLARGVNWDALERLGINPSDSPDVILQKINDMGGLHDKGFMSTCPNTSDLPWITSSKPIRFIMDVKGSTGAVDLSPINSAEHEILLQDGLTFDATKVEYDKNGTLMIYLKQK